MQICGSSEFDDCANSFLDDLLFLGLLFEAMKDACDELFLLIISERVDNFIVDDVCEYDLLEVHKHSSGNSLFILLFELRYF